MTERRDLGCCWIKKKKIGFVYCCLRFPLFPMDLEAPLCVASGVGGRQLCHPAPLSNIWVNRALWEFLIILIECLDPLRRGWITQGHWAESGFRTDLTEQNSGAAPCCQSDDKEYETCFERTAGGCRSMSAFIGVFGT